MTAEQTFEALEHLGRAERKKAVRQLIYKKGKRPACLTQQLRLMEMFHHDHTLGQFERTYALVAAAHKASETLDTASLVCCRNRLHDRFVWARTLPMRKALRKDGLHMRFSILNVQINSAILLGMEDGTKYAQEALDCLSEIDPRRTTHYSFNSTTNILNTVGLALLVKPEALPDTIDMIRAMLFHSIRMKFAGELSARILPRSLPSHLSMLSPPSHFIKFEESFRKFLTLKSAADITSDRERRGLYWSIAEECVLQSTNEQKQAHLDAVRRHLTHRWTSAAPPCGGNP